MSEEGRVEAPERLIICTDGHKPVIADWAKEHMKECDIEYVRAQPPMADTERVAREIVHAAIKRRVADGSVVGKPWELIDQITTALSAAKQQGRDEQREKDARLAQTMATGEDVTTGRLKAINIAAAIRTSGVTND